MYPYLPQESQYALQFPGRAGGFHKALNSPPTCSLSPMIPNNAWPLRITAAAGTKLAGPSSGIDQVQALQPSPFFTLTVVYTPRGFILHAASLRQAFAHCAIFVTAALRGGPGSVSVPI